MNQAHNVRAVPMAIAAGAISIRLNLVSGESVQHSPVASGPARDGIDVPAISLDQALADLSSGPCDYVKMDCEGGEYDILFRAGPQAIATLRRVCLEYHDGVTPYTHADLLRFFAEQGFRTRLTPSPAHADLGYLYAEK